MADSTSCENEGDGRSWVSVRERRVGASNSNAGRTEERRGSHLFQSRATRRVVRRERLRVVFSSGDARRQPSLGRAVHVRERLEPSRADGDALERRPKCMLDALQLGALTLQRPFGAHLSERDEECEA